MTKTKKRLLTRYLWFLVVLVTIGVGSTAYSTFISRRAVQGDIFDKLFAEDAIQNTWAFTQSLHIACGGIFVVGTLLLAIAWFNAPTE